MSASILIVDDDATLRWTLAHRLSKAGFATREAVDGRAGLAAVRAERPDVVLLDYRLPDIDGLEVLDQLVALEPELPILMLTSHASIEHAVEAMRRGAFYYLTKDADLDGVRAAVTAALAARAVAPTGDAIEFLVGESEPIRQLKALTRRIARSPASTVLITGESGTGKSLMARAIHEASPRVDAPFLTIPAMAVPAALLESELFGHERGAFTDAKAPRVGLLEQAHLGTVFLDEIGDMAPALQAKLLHFLEERCFRRVGGTHEIRPDVRVVTATNVPLRDAVADGSFRADLYYRLAVLTIHLPPLRARGEDVLRLASYFIERFAREFESPVRRLTDEAAQRMLGHHWPGNVRELRNTIERAVLLGEGPTVPASALQFGQLVPGSADPFVLPEDGVDLEALERSLVVQALERTGGNRTQAGALLGLNRDQIRYRVRKFGL